MKNISKILEYLKPDRDDKAGLYLTVIFHLVILIILLAYSIHKQLKTETSFVLDFTGQEELEKRQQYEAMQASVSAELDELIRAAAQGSTPRNVAVDANLQSELKDDRHSSPNEVYDEARRLQEKLDQSRRDAERARDSEDDIDLGNSRPDTETEAYRGPSVISYSLDGRKAMSLPVPAYKCMGAGDVTVTIIVNRKGYVVSEKILESVSSKDQCLRDYALKAASRSRFSSVSKDAPERQGGQIVYRFVSQ